MMGKMRNQAGYRANSADIHARAPKPPGRDAGLMDELLHGATTRIFAGMAGRFLVRLGRMFVLGLAIGAFLWLVGALTPAHGAANDVIGQPDSPEQADLAEQPQCRMSWTEVRGHRTDYTFKYYPDLWRRNPENRDLGGS